MIDRISQFLVRYGIGIENLNPIAIGILDEGQTLHAAIVGFLDEFHAMLLEAVHEIYNNNTHIY